MKEPTWEEFFDEVCRRAESKMLQSGKLEGMHYASMREYRNEILQRRVSNKDHLFARGEHHG